MCERAPSGPAPFLSKLEPNLVRVDRQTEQDAVVLVVEIDWQIVSVVLADEDVVLNGRAAEKAVADAQPDAVLNFVVDAGAELKREAGMVGGEGRTLIVQKAEGLQKDTVDVRA